MKADVIVPKNQLFLLVPDDVTQKDSPLIMYNFKPTTSRKESYLAT